MIRTGAPLFARLDRGRTTVLRHWRTLKNELPVYIQLFFRNFSTLQGRSCQKAYKWPANLYADTVLFQGVLIYFALDTDVEIFLATSRFRAAFAYQPF